MTNFEHLKNEFTNMTAEDFAIWIIDNVEWCSGGPKCSSFERCSDCCLAWLNQEHAEPMPELETGMFVEVRYRHEDDDDYRAKPRCEKIGLVANGMIVYQSGGYDFLNNDEEDEDVKNDEIMAVYRTYSFDMCNERTCIWRRGS